MPASYEQARVIGVQPVYETVSYTVPREQCNEQRVQTASGGGMSPAIPLLGAIAGGALGSAVANGHNNKQAGAVIGAVFGGAVGYDVARRNATPRYVTYGTQEVCTEVQDMHEEERISGYNVRYYIPWARPIRRSRVIRLATRCACEWMCPRRSNERTVWMT